MIRALIALSLVVALVGSAILGRSTRGTSAQDGADALAGHPLVGSWVAVTPFGAAAETFAADGSVRGRISAN